MHIHSIAYRHATRHGSPAMENQPTTTGVKPTTDFGPFTKLLRHLWYCFVTFKKTQMVGCALTAGISTSYRSQGGALENFLNFCLESFPRMGFIFRSTPSCIATNNCLWRHWNMMHDGSTHTHTYIQSHTHTHTRTHTRTHTHSHMREYRELEQ